MHKEKLCTQELMVLSLFEFNNRQHNAYQMGSLAMMIFILLEENSKKKKKICIASHAL